MEPTKIIDRRSGEVLEECPTCGFEAKYQAVIDGMERELRAKRLRIAKLEAELQEQEENSPGAPDIREVLEDWHRKLGKDDRTKIPAGGDRWMLVKRAMVKWNFSKDELIRANTGMLLKPCVADGKGRCSADTEGAKRYDEIKIILGEVSSVERFIRYADEDEQRFTQAEPREPGPLPPHNLEAERNLLGAVLTLPAVLDRVSAAGLRPQHFYREAHGRVYATMEKIRRRGDTVDVVLVCDEMEQMGWFDETHDQAWVYTLASEVPLAANGPAYAKLILRDAAARAGIRSAEDLQRALASGDDVAAAAARAALDPNVTQLAIEEKAA